MICVSLCCMACQSSLFRQSFFPCVESAGKESIVGPLGVLTRPLQRQKEQDRTRSRPIQPTDPIQPDPDPDRTPRHSTRRQPNHINQPHTNDTIPTNYIRNTRPSSYHHLCSTLIAHLEVESRIDVTSSRQQESTNITIVTQRTPVETIHSSTHSLIALHPSIHPSSTRPNQPTRQQAYFHR